jgi:hypothetical protein
MTPPEPATRLTASARSSRGRRGRHRFDRWCWSVAEAQADSEDARGAKAIVIELRGFRAQQGVGVATEMLLTNAQQVSDDGACATGLRPEAVFSIDESAMDPVAKSMHWTRPTTMGSSDPGMSTGR